MFPYKDPLCSHINETNNNISLQSTRLPNFYQNNYIILWIIFTLFVFKSRSYWPFDGLIFYTTFIGQQLLAIWCLGGLKPFQTLIAAQLLVFIYIYILRGDELEIGILINFKILHFFNLKSLGTEHALQWETFLTQNHCILLHCQWK